MELQQPVDRRDAAFYGARVQVGTIAQLWRYPVKSMAGERLERASITWRGIPGDRGWAVFDEARRGVTNAKRLPPLLRCRARYLTEPVPGEASPPVEIELPRRQDRRLQR